MMNAENQSGRGGGRSAPTGGTLDTQMTYSSAPSVIELISEIVDHAIERPDEYKLPGGELMLLLNDIREVCDGWKAARPQLLTKAARGTVPVGELQH